MVDDNNRRDRAGAHDSDTLQPLKALTAGEVQAYLDSRPLAWSVSPEYCKTYSPAETLLCEVSNHQLEHGDIIQVCLSGSHAYGTSRPDSDIDVRGVFIAPTSSFLGFFEPAQEVELAQYGDVKLFEINKFLSLCMKGNPHQLEIFFSDNYINSQVWQEIAQERSKVLAKDGIKSAYLGFADSEYRKLKRNPEHHKLMKRWAHIFRLLDQGKQLLQEAHLDVKLSEETITFIKSVQAGDVNDEILDKIFEEKCSLLKNAYEASKLPAKAAWKAMNNILIDIRQNRG